MDVLFVFDETIANKIRAAGAREITTQYGIKQNAWIFDYSDPMRFCFYINVAVEKQKCMIMNNLFMAF